VFVPSGAYQGAKWLKLTYQEGGTVARTAASRKISKTVKPALKLVKGGEKVAKTGIRKKSVALRDLSLSTPERTSRELPLHQQEALIMKYRVKARKLGRSILRRWHARMDIEEVDSIVDLSLCETVKRFDPQRGASFMTFLFYHLKGNLVRAVIAAASTSAIPLAIADMVDVNPYESEDRGRGRSSGLNAMELAEAISSQEVLQPDEALWRKEMSDMSALACSKLDDLEREIVKRIFIQEQQIIDIAAQLGYSRCHISRVKKKALDTLQDELRVAINHDDCALIDEGVDKEREQIEMRIASRKEIHRRRPRSAANVRAHEALPEAEAA
jgi:RNA polymerase sigma factor (sigma-70 family)